MIKIAQKQTHSILPNLTFINGHIATIEDYTTLVTWLFLGRCKILQDTTSKCGIRNIETS